MVWEHLSFCDKLYFLCSPFCGINCKVKLHYSTYSSNHGNGIKRVFQVQEQIENQLNNMIVNYRDDPDLQNLVDWVQKDWVNIFPQKFDVWGILNLVIHVFYSLAQLVKHQTLSLRVMGSSLAGSSRLSPWWLTLDQALSLTQLTLPHGPCEEALGC